MSSVQLVVTVIRAVDDKNVAVDLFVIRRVQCGWKPAARCRFIVVDHKQVIHRQTLVMVD